MSYILPISGAFLLIVLFVGYFFLAIYEGPKKKMVNLRYKFAAVFTLIFGAMMLLGWIYLFVSGFQSFKMDVSNIVPHVVLEFISALLFIVSGIALFKRMSRAPALHMISCGVFIFTNVLALLTFGRRGHPVIMNEIVILTMIGLVYAIGLIFAWEHFVMRLDNDQQK
ncbi:MAG: hypothetical protein AB7F43_07840 [Bacteriovoracia bacterium]